MKYFKSVRLDFIAFTFFALCIVITYWSLPNTFFQQDEWYGFNVYNKIDAIGGLRHFINEVFFTFGKTHYTPLAEVGSYLQYKLFDLYFPFYAYVSIFMHVLNTILVFVFVNQLVKNRLIAFLSTLLFAVNSITHQAVSWIAASLNTQGATFFSLVFYILFFQYIKNKERNKKIVFLSFASLIIGLLLKEIIAPFLLVPFFYFFYSMDKSIQSAKKVFIPFVFFLFLYLTLRFVIYINAPPLFSGNVELVQAGIPEYLYRITILPFRVIAQSLIPANYLLSFSEFVVRISYPQFSYSDGSVDPVIRETAGYDIVCFFITLIIIITAISSFKFFKKRNEYFSKGIVLFLLIPIFSAILIIFIPGKAGYVSLIEPRHLYSGSFGAGGLLVLTFLRLSSWFTKSKSKIILITVIFVLTSLHMWKIKNDIVLLKEMGETRRNILTQIASSYPDLPQKIVIYTQSDTAYYGLPDTEKILPVQVGFGGMLLAWYHKNENFPSCIYDIPLFLEILGQGYKECNGRGFGYFRKIDSLQKAVKENKLDPTIIIAFSYNSTSGILSETTEEVRSQVIKTLPIK